MDQLGESIRKLILAGIGAAAVTKEKSEGLLKELEELKHNLKDAIRDNVTVNVVRPDVMDAVDNMTDAELEALKARIHAAEARRSAEEKTEEGTGEAPEAEATEETNETESK